MKNQHRLAVVVAVCACFALALPALASAAVWKHNGVNLAKFISLSLPGGEVFESETSAGEWSGMSCEVKATMTTEGGNTAKITAYEIKSCSTSSSFGKLKGCEVVAKEAKGLPWTVHVNTTTLTITNMRVRRTFKAGCAVAEIDKTISPTVTLNTPSNIAEMEFKGSIAGYKAFGSWKVEGTNSGTYGIG